MSIKQYGKEKSENMGITKIAETKKEDLPVSAVKETSSLVEMFGLKRLFHLIHRFPCLLRG